MSDSSPPAGWYDDPENHGQQRYWDGASWAAPVAATPPPPGSATGAVSPMQASGTNGMAIASLVLGILWLWWIGSILAVIFGHVAKSQLAQPGNDQQGDGLATAGLILGYIGVGTLALFMLLVAVAASTS
jgi:hypothetical protein